MNLIEPNKYYSVRYLTDNNILPWMTSHHSLTSYLETERGKEILKPVIRHTKSHTRYMIKGDVIIELFKKAEEGTLIM